MSDLIEKLGAVYNALKAGQQLDNAEAWAKGGNAAAALVVIVQSINILARSFGFDLQWDAVNVHQVADGISLVGVAIASILHTASNPHSGFRK